MTRSVLATALALACATTQALAQTTHSPASHKADATTVVYVSGSGANNVSILASDSGRVKFVPITKRSLVSARLSIGSEELRMGIDYVPIDPGYNARPVINAEVIYGGEIEDTLHQITPAQAVGRVVVFTTRSRDAMTLSITPGSRWSNAVAIVTINTDEGFAKINSLGWGTSMVVWPESFVSREVPISLAVTRASAAKFFNAPFESLAVGTTGRRVDARFLYKAN